MRKNKKTKIKMITSDNSFNAMTDNLVAFNDEQGVTLKNTNISSTNLVTSIEEGIDRRIAIFEGNSKNIKDGGLSIAEVIANIPTTYLSSIEQYIVQDKDVMIIAANSMQIILPPVASNINRQLILKYQENQSQEITINAVGLDSIDGTQTVILNGSGYLHLVASNAGDNRWHVISSSINEENPNPVFETITCTESPSSLQDTTINGLLTANDISCNGNGIFNSIHSIGNITSNQLGLSGNNNSYLVIAANPNQEQNLTLTYPDTLGISGQVLSTDGQGNLSWINNGGGSGSGTVTSVGLTNTDNNLTITGSPVTTSGNIAVNLSDNITAKLGTFYYLESNSAIVKGQVIADDFITDGGFVAEGTVSAGTLVSKGDITAASDVTGLRLNLDVNDTTHLTLEPNIAQKNDLTLILPPNAGEANQVLSTDGYGNLAWVDTDIVINNSTTGKNTLNGTAGVVIKTSAITTHSIVSVTRNAGIGTPQIVTKTGNLIVGSIIEKVSFTVYSTTENDTDDFDWFILNPKIS
jgi:hypothetical protein